MKVVLVNTYEKKGGAAIAAGRLYNALKSKDLQVDFFVQNADSTNVSSFANNFFKNKLSFLRFSRERFKVLRNIKHKENLYGFDTASFGVDISNNKLIQQADVIHIHWVNFGFISLNSLLKLAQLNKPILWTLHDMWVLTGGCFYSQACNKYQDACENCHFLKDNSSLAEKIFNVKKEIFKNPNFHAAAISSWTKSIIEKSYFFKNKDVIELSNPIDTELFTFKDKLKTKKKLNLSVDKIHIGFVAFNVNDKRKGAIFLKQSLELLFNEKPDLKNKVELIAIGSSKNEEFFDNLPVFFTGYISNVKNLIDYYNACNFMLLPSVEDNLPLVIQEAMACKTPIIAFDTGGIKDLVIHQKTGYLSKHLDVVDFKNGILNFIENSTVQIGENARSHIVKNYSNEIIAKKAVEVYQSLLK
ncbi:MAG: glycosyltransferase [Bacteroidales bacterium]|nr:glycosyltransferase [Bacteroidales bacterium]